MKKILVTGSMGFIPSHVIAELHNRGYEVIGLERHFGSVTKKEIYHPDQVYLADLRDKEAVEKAVSMSDGVINLAGILGTQETVQNPYPSVEVNVIGALNVFEAARIWKVPVVQIAVGNYFEKNSYSLTKTCTEGFAQMYARNNGLRINVVRALNAFGERQKVYPVRKIIPSFITRALSGQDIQIYGDGQQMMDMVAVNDVATVLVNVLEDLFKPDTETGKVFEVGTGVGYTVKYIAEQVIKYCGTDTKIEHLPMRPGETPGAKVVASNPYPIKYTDFNEKLKQTVQWYKDNKSIWQK